MRPHTAAGLTGVGSVEGPEERVVVLGGHVGVGGVQQDPVRPQQLLHLLLQLLLVPQDGGGRGGRVGLLYHNS